MKKKILMIILCGVLLVGLTGCSSKKESSNNIEDIREISDKYVFI